MIVSKNLLYFDIVHKYGKLSINLKNCLQYCYEEKQLISKF